MNRYDLIILGSLAESDMSGYDIIQRVKEKGMDRWAKIHVSTVYSRLASLESRKNLISRTEREGNRPERTIYSLTSQGRKLLSKEVLSHLTGFNDDPRTLGFAYLHGAPTEQILASLKKQAEHLSGEIAHIETLINTAEIPSFFEEGPFLNCMSRDHMQVELKYVNAAIEILSNPSNSEQMTEYFSINRSKNFKTTPKYQEKK